MNLVKASLRHPQVLYVLTAMTCLAGFFALQQMPRREDPKIPIRRGLVMAAYPGATAEQVENQLTRKIEQRLFAYEEVRKSKTVSTSLADGVVIDVRLEDDVESLDLFWSRLRHDLNELAFTDLPKGVLGPIVRSDFGDVIAVLVAVTGDRYTNSELQDYLRRLETEVLRIPAASKVKRIGEQPEKIYVTSTMQRLVQYGITPLHLIGALQGQNVLTTAGAFDAGQTRAAIRTSGLYRKDDEIRRQMVGMSPQGSPIYVGDLANVERRDADPDFMIRANSKPSVMLTVEMRPGFNIVDFGHQVEETLERVKQDFPPGIDVATIVSQPDAVEERITHFLGEFAFALLAVVIACMLLLPFPVAAVASTAIPITVAMTFAILRFVGIELHQVSLAALVVVLGIVVDDAIVIADNYVELLDEGYPPEEAAWRSATHLARPVLVATLVIVAAFVPLAFLPGTMGEWLFSLPVTIGLALLNSYVVAMLLTPLLCRAYIKKGLHAAGQKPSLSGRLLDKMQGSYTSVITLAMANKRMTMALGVLAVLAGLGLGATVDQRFFPPAERNEFAINVWMPEGTRLEATNDAVLTIEKALDKEEEILSYASFVGQGAPRFFYSFEPALPRPNMAQIIVQTSAVHVTPEVVSRMRAELSELVPNAELDVQRLAQADPMWAPIEVRISGNDLTTLKELAGRVATVLENTPGSYMVRQDFREDAYGLQVALRPELANRLGMNTTVVSNMLAGTFLGLPVTQFWEGDKSLDVVLRMDESHRASAEDVGSTYMVSQFARMPLSGIADVTPVWNAGRIVHRNGVRTITVGSFTRENVLPSNVLKEAQATLDTMTLPRGYDMAYGGEIESQTETFGYMTVGLFIGIMMIFIILLFEFQSVKDSLIVLTAIPLALFGAFFGLVLTRNPFGFTAFMGLMALSGVVARNAIILIDYIREKRAEGEPIEMAAREAGQRRLRPIFLTTIAAAAGLTPMMLSGSALWSPLASVIAFGLFFSMIFTLIIVPVLYVMVTRETVTPAMPAKAQVEEELQPA